MKKKRSFPKEDTYCDHQILLVRVKTGPIICQVCKKPCKQIIAYGDI
jgi:hypothetical protein